MNELYVTNLRVTLDNSLRLVQLCFNELLYDNRHMYMYRLCLPQLYTHTSTHKDTQMYTCTHMYTHANTCIHTHTHAHTHTCTIHIYIYVDITYIHKKYVHTVYI